MFVYLLRNINVVETIAIITPARRKRPISMRSLHSGEHAQQKFQNLNDIIFKIS